MSIKFITLTNTGYIDYTINCLKSLNNINSELNLNCYCIGKDGYNKLKNAGYNVELIDDDDENSNFQNFRTGNWSNIVFNKFKIIHKNLLTDSYVLITDGDIIYENKDFITYLIENIKDNDMLIQNDMMNDNDNSVLCSGFMFIKSNARTLQFFNPKVMEFKKNTVGWDDQVYINNHKQYIKYKLLPLALFPNGKYYYENFHKLSPYLIHFNWVVGHEKKNKMIKFCKWFD